ncbi:MULTISPECIES: prolyl aminopeptidase [unclassified Leptolyngbya]|uniref:prolyl aminopeptidase n=1 Tax=unclassified Leptolyngbya TaxID=2650499 RepID=UPI001AD1FA3B|nr:MULTISPECIES: prolyl aminopeptidase [unclassified Leptolyngbya]MBN8562258.1 prolyl aminopeptidase [Leptolyngbya sp. UWPOB_LEPTO1]MCY6492500.1 prolyl aminopeptidase [Leptolyngbya sp. GGD]
MRQLYPAIAPYQSGMLPVSDLHTIYYEQSGNPNGKPVVFLHGGPGGGTIPTYRQYFDPSKWRIILFDQRGAGKSTPHAELRENTTWDLVSDIEKLRSHLNIDRWFVFGGSWGSTLSLAYSQTHPDRCLGLILRGIFLLRRKEILWFYQDGASWIFPDAWEHYLEPIPPEERDDMISAYYRRLTSEDAEIRSTAAKAWSVWEGTTSRLIVDPSLQSKFADDEFADAFARIECHYFINRGFFETDDQLLQNCDRIAHIPTVIVQGRYDVVCPMTSAWALHKALPESELIVVPDAGHSMMEAGILSALIDATDRFVAQKTNGKI